MKQRYISPEELDEIQADVDIHNQADGMCGCSQFPQFLHQGVTMFVGPNCHRWIDDIPCLIAEVRRLREALELINSKTTIESSDISDIVRETLR